VVPQKEWWLLSSVHRVTLLDFLRGGGLDFRRERLNRCCGLSVKRKGLASELCGNGTRECFDDRPWYVLCLCWRPEELCRQKFKSDVEVVVLAVSVEVYCKPGVDAALRQEEVHVLISAPPNANPANMEAAARRTLSNNGAVL